MSRCLIFALSLVTILGCSTGGATTPPPAKPPVISNVSPSGNLGEPGDQVDFHVVATNTPKSWEWSFGGGGIPNDSSEEAPHIMLGAVGTYSGWVTASNAAGPSARLAFAFSVVQSVIAPVIQSVAPSGTAGRAGDHVQFVATVGGNPNAWQWHFGGGILPTDSLDSSPSVILSGPGDFSGTVTACNVTGCSETMSFTYHVDPGTNPAPKVVSVSPSGNAGFPAARARLSARTDVQVTDWFWSVETGAGSLDDPRFAEPILTLGDPGTYQGHVIACGSGGCSDPEPFTVKVTAPGSWATYTIPPVAKAGQIYGVSVAILADGTPAILYYRNDGDGLQFVTSSRPVPRSADDWKTLPCELTSFTMNPVLMVRDGIPIALLSDGIMVANSDKPDSSGGWTMHAGFVPPHASACLYGEQIALRNNDSHMRVSRIPLPVTNTDWSDSVPLGSPITLGPVTLAGRLYVCGDATTDGMPIASTAVPIPETSTAWQAFSFVGPPAGATPVGFALREGAPLVTFVQEKVHLSQAQSPDVIPNGASEWRISPIGDLTANYLSSPCALQGSPLIAAVKLTPSGNDYPNVSTVLYLPASSSPVDPNAWGVQTSVSGAGTAIELDPTSGTASLLFAGAENQAFVEYHGPTLWFSSLRVGAYSAP